MESISPSQPHSQPPADFNGGMEWMIDASGCDANRLRDLKCIQSLCENVIRDLGLSVVGDPLSHAFPGAGGVTAMYLLSESHLACHTYPERAFATFNLYCCRQRPEWPWQERLANELGAQSIMVRCFDRRSDVTADRQNRAHRILESHR